MIVRNVKYGQDGLRVGFTLLDAMRICSHGRSQFVSGKTLSVEERFNRLRRVLAYKVVNNEHK